MGLGQTSMEWMTVFDIQSHMYRWPVAVAEARYWAVGFSCGRFPHFTTETEAEAARRVARGSVWGDGVFEEKCMTLRSHMRREPSAYPAAMTWMVGLTAMAVIFPACSVSELERVAVVAARKWQRSSVSEVEETRMWSLEELTSDETD